MKTSQNPEQQFARGCATLVLAASLCIVAVMALGVVALGKAIF